MFHESAAESAALVNRDTNIESAGVYIDVMGPFYHLREGVLSDKLFTQRYFLVVATSLTSRQT